MQPENFGRKLEALKSVWKDLQNKSMQVEYVDMREFPQKKSTALGDRGLIGRVIVRPVESSPAPIKKYE